MNAEQVALAGEKLNSLPCPMNGRLIWMNGMEWKACRKCGEVKPLTTGFYPHKDCKDGHTGQCRSCISQRVNKSEYRKKKTRTEKLKAADLKVIRQTLPRDCYPRTCGHYNPNDRMIYDQEHLDHVVDLWVEVIKRARESNPHFFVQKGGVYEWLKMHMGAE